MLPTWAYLLVAFLIAAIAFATAQMLPGSGMIIVMLASTLWVAYAARRQQRNRRLG